MVGSQRVDQRRRNSLIEEHHHLNPQSSNDNSLSRSYQGIPHQGIINCVSSDQIQQM